jgi:hypothetical protein
VDWHLYACIKPKTISQVKANLKFEEDLMKGSSQT